MLRALGWIALAITATALLCAIWGGTGTYLAMSLGIFGIAAGWLGFRRTIDPGPARLAGAGAVTLGALALTLGSLRYGLTLIAINRLESIL